MNYDKSPNETETLSADERKLREMCLTLNKVDAPKDFDFKLKARIAGAKHSDFEPRFGFAWRYALPVLALIVVLGLLAYNVAFSTSSNSPLIADNPVAAPPNPALSQNSTISSVAPPEQNPNQNPADSPANQNLPKTPQAVVAVNKPKNLEVVKTREIKNDNFRGSAVKSAKRAPILLPNGFDQNSVMPKNLDIQPSSPIQVKDVLSINGINADLENGKWKVRSVTANSVGESSGVKENDVIEAIDEQPLSAETVFVRTVKGQTITITRNGEKSQLKLRVKQ